MIEKLKFSIKNHNAKKPIFLLSVIACLSVFIFAFWYFLSSNNCKSAFNSGNFNKAFSACMKRAQKGDADAQALLGYMYTQGLGTSQDFTNASYWYGQAAEHGSFFGRFTQIVNQMQANYAEGNTSLSLNNFNFGVSTKECTDKICFQTIDDLSTLANEGYLPAQESLCSYYMNTMISSRSYLATLDTTTGSIRYCGMARNQGSVMVNDMLAHFFMNGIIADDNQFSEGAIVSTLVSIQLAKLNLQQEQAFVIKNPADGLLKFMTTPAILDRVNEDLGNLSMLQDQLSPEQQKIILPLVQQKVQEALKQRENGETYKDQ